MDLHIVDFGYSGLGLPMVVGAGRVIHMKAREYRTRPWCTACGAGGSDMPGLSIPSCLIHYPPHSTFLSSQPWINLYPLSQL